MPHTSRHTVRIRPRPRTASALLALALAGCALPHKNPVPSGVTTGATNPDSTAKTQLAPMAVRVTPDPPAILSRPSTPLGDSVAPINPLDTVNLADVADVANMANATRASREDTPLAQGLASWYGPGFHGRRTANGERYDMHALTAAHKTLPFGTRVRVRSVHTGKEVIVRINDRGPYKHSRIIDLSLAAITALGGRPRGVTEVVLLRE